MPLSVWVDNLFVRALEGAASVGRYNLAVRGTSPGIMAGVYAALAAGSQVPVATAFRAGRASLQAAGFVEGDPEDYLHPLGHPHRTPERTKEPNWRACHGCCPPVHGEVRLVAQRVANIVFRQLRLARNGLQAATQSVA